MYGQRRACAAAAGSGARRRAGGPGSAAAKAGRGKCGTPCPARPLGASTRHASIPQAARGVNWTGLCVLREPGSGATAAVRRRIAVPAGSRQLSAARRGDDEPPRKQGIASRPKPPGPGPLRSEIIQQKTPASLPGFLPVAAPETGAASRVSLRTSSADRPGPPSGIRRCCPWSRSSAQHAGNGRCTCPWSGRHRRIPQRRGAGRRWS